MKLKRLISFSFIALLLAAFALPMALSLLQDDNCLEIAECALEEDETEEEVSTRLLEEDIESVEVSHLLVFQSINNTKHISYIKNYVPTVFDVPTEPPEFIG